MGHDDWFVYILICAKIVHACLKSWDISFVFYPNNLQLIVFTFVRLDYKWFNLTECCIDIFSFHSSKPHDIAALLHAIKHEDRIHIHINICRISLAFLSFHPGHSFYCAKLWQPWTDKYRRAIYIQVFQQPSAFNGFTVKSGIPEILQENSLP